MATGFRYVLKGGDGDLSDVFVCVDGRMVCCKALYGAGKYAAQIIVAFDGAIRIIYSSNKDVMNVMTLFLASNMKQSEYLITLEKKYR